MFQFSGCDFNILFCSDINNCLLRQLGFPIRKSPDQSVFAAPRSLSQLTTSFIASYRQGIHLLPVTVCLPVSYIIKKDKLFYVACSKMFYFLLAMTMNCQRTKNSLSLKQEKKLKLTCRSSETAERNKWQFYNGGPSWTRTSDPRVINTML